jgi:hypothetical protein
MRKPPTNSATPEKKIEDDVQPRELLAHLVGELAGGLHVGPVADHVLDAPLERPNLAAVRGRDRDLHPPPRLIEQAAGGRQWHGGVAESADVQAARELEDADDRQLRPAGRPRYGHPVADRV